MLTCNNFRLSKQNKYEDDGYYISSNNTDCVKVDKDGNGLRHLWQQCLTSFPQVRIETAEAIMAVYPTFVSLIEAYDKCHTQEERENLLEDIPIRRMACPFANSRKVGPELSKKICQFYTSLDIDVYV